MLAVVAVLVALPVDVAPADAKARAEAYYHYSLGLQSRLSGEAQQALEEYRKAQKLDPASAPVRTEMARLLMDAGRFDEALVEAEAAARLDPDDPEAHFTLARVLQVQAEISGNAAALKRSLAEYETTVKLRPGDTLALRTGAKLLDWARAR